MDYSNKFISRDSSVGCSSRIYYYNNGEGVPFKWEMQPGVAKYQPKEEIPPLSPPPAALSLGFPKPCIPQEPRRHSTRSRLLHFWKKSTKIGKVKKLPEGSKECPAGDVGNVRNEFDVFTTSIEYCSSDSESMASPRASSVSSSSSVSFVKDCHSSSESPGKEIYGRNLGCIPMQIHIGRIMVSISRRD